MTDTGIDIPGPIDHESASHWVEYDHDNFTVETWCRFGPKRQFKLRSRVRPMVEAEIIFSKLRGHTRDAVLRAHGVIEHIAPPTPPHRSLIQRLKDYLPWPTN